MQYIHRNPLNFRSSLGTCILLFYTLHNSNNLCSLTAPKQLKPSDHWERKWGRKREEREARTDWCLEETLQVRVKNNSLIEEETEYWHRGLGELWLQLCIQHRGAHKDSMSLWKEVSLCFKTPPILPGRRIYH